MKNHDTFCVSMKEKTIIFHIIGYDNTKIKNICTAITEMLNTMKKRGDFIYEDEKDFIGMIIDEAWKKHIHLEYDYPTYGTINVID